MGPSLLTTALDVQSAEEYLANLKTLSHNWHMNTTQMPLILGLLSLSATLLSPVSRADWSAAELTKIHAIAQAPIKINDGFASTIWGSLQSLKNATGTHGQDLVLKGLTGFRSPVTVTLAARPAQEGARPLILLIPGMFSDAKNANALRLQEQLYAAGNHVLLIANPWSTQFTEFYPEMETGQRELEADAVIGALDRVISQELGSARVKSFALMGQSYGALLATVIAGRLPAKLQPLFDERLILISPARDMAKSTKLIDVLLKETLSSYESGCTDFFSKLDFLNFSKADPYTAPSAKVLSCGKGLVVHAGFREKLLEVTRTKEKVMGNSWIPTDSAAKAAFERSFSMDQFLSLASPSVYAILHAGKTKTLGEWLTLAKQNQALNLKILSASDDPLNEVKGWQQDTTYSYGGSELQLLPFGGHSGFVSFPEFAGLAAIF